MTLGSCALISEHFKLTARISYIALPLYSQLPLEHIEESICAAISAYPVPCVFPKSCKCIEVSDGLIQYKQVCGACDIFQINVRREEVSWRKNHYVRRIHITKLDWKVYDAR